MHRDEDGGGLPADVVHGGDLALRGAPREEAAPATAGAYRAVTCGELALEEVASRVEQYAAAARTPVETRVFTVDAGDTGAESPEQGLPGYNSRYYLRRQQGSEARIAVISELDGVVTLTTRVEAAKGSPAPENTHLAVTEAELERRGTGDLVHRVLAHLGIPYSTGDEAGEEGENPDALLAQVPDEETLAAENARELAEAADAAAICDACGLPETDPGLDAIARVQD